MKIVVAGKLLDRLSKSNQQTGTSRRTAASLVIEAKGKEEKGGWRDHEDRLLFVFHAVRPLRTGTQIFARAALRGKVELLSLSGINARDA